MSPFYCEVLLFPIFFWRHRLVPWNPCSLKPTVVCFYGMQTTTRIEMNWNVKGRRGTNECMSEKWILHLEQIDMRSFYVYKLKQWPFCKAHLYIKVVLTVISLPSLCVENNWMLAERVSFKRNLNRIKLLLNIHIIFPFLLKMWIMNTLRNLYVMFDHFLNECWSKVTTV